MTQKVYEDSRNPTEASVWFNGTKLATYSVVTGRLVRGNAIFSRPKPNPVRPTDFLFNHDSWNPTIYDRRTGVSGKESGRIGPAIFSYNTGARSVIESDDGQAGLTKALASLTGAGASFGESLGEARTTAAMIQKRTKQLGAFALALKRGDLGAAARALGLDELKNPKKVRQALESKKPANAYLETMYGWRPVVDEISNAAELYAKGISTRGARIKKISGQLPKFDYDWNPGEGLPPLATRGGFYGIIDNPTMFDLNKAGLFNPLETGWNLVSLSFVFDWLVPVGTYLGALTGTAGLRSVGGWVQTQNRNTAFVGVTSATANIPWSVSYTGRRIPTGVFPSLSVLKNGAAGNFGQIVSLAALMRQRLGR